MRKKETSDVRVNRCGGEKQKWPITGNRRGMKADFNVGVMVDRLRAERGRLDTEGRAQKRQRGSDRRTSQTKSTTGRREDGRVDRMTGDRHTHTHTGIASDR